MKIIEMLNKKTNDTLKELENKKELINAFTYYVKTCGDMWVKDTFYSYGGYEGEYCLTIEFKNEQGYRSFGPLRTCAKLKLIKDIEEYFNNL